MIPEPQRTHILELLVALGPAADDFVVAGAQAMKFAVAETRATKNVDFVLNVLALREQPVPLADPWPSSAICPCLNLGISNS
jgi:hypothetical protein